MNQLAIFDGDGNATREARVARDVGMKAALDHAEADVPGWSDAAMAYLNGYALTHDRFTGWLVTTSADLSRSVPTPATAKAWGSIFTKAQRLKIIVKDGYTQDPNRHASPVPVWRSLVFGRAG